MCEITLENIFCGRSVLDFHATSHDRFLQHLQEMHASVNDLQTLGLAKKDELSNFYEAYNYLESDLDLAETTLQKARIVLVTAAAESTLNDAWLQCVSMIKLKIFQKCIEDKYVNRKSLGMGCFPGVYNDVGISAKNFDAILNMGVCVRHMVAHNDYYINEKRLGKFSACKVKNVEVGQDFDVVNFDTEEYVRTWSSYFKNLEGVIKEVYTEFEAKRLQKVEY